MSPPLLYCCLDVSGHFAAHEGYFATTSPLNLYPNYGVKSDDFHVERVVFVVLFSVADHPRSCVHNWLDSCL